MAKMYPFVFSLIYISLSNEFHEIIMVRLSEERKFVLSRQI